jgi:hypothetical protein
MKRPFNRPTEKVPMTLRKMSLASTLISLVVLTSSAYAQESAGWMSLKFGGGTWSGGLPSSMTSDSFGAMIDFDVEIPVGDLLFVGGGIMAGIYGFDLPRMEGDRSAARATVDQVPIHLDVGTGTWLSEHLYAYGKLGVAAMMVQIAGSDCPEATIIITRGLSSEETPEQEELTWKHLCETEGPEREWHPAGIGTGGLMYLFSEAALGFALQVELVALVAPGHDALGSSLSHVAVMAGFGVGFR